MMKETRLPSGKGKRLLTILAAAFVLCLLMCTAAFAAETDSSTGYSWTGGSEGITPTDSSSDSGTTTTTITISASGTFTLTSDVSANIAVSGSNINVTIDLNGHTLTGSGGSVIKIEDASESAGANVTLQDSSSDASGVITGGTGTSSTNFSSSQTDEYKACGGGVFVGKNCTLTMTGGTIKNCSAVFGGGVFVSSGSTFTMSGGTISSCSVAGSGDPGSRGGGVYVYLGTFNMSGGTITGCSAEGTYSGGGVFAACANFTMSGGTISSCTGLRGGGVCIDDGGTSDDNAGTYVTTLSGGTITGCTASSGGAGVYVYGSYNPKLIVSGVTISDNTAASGKGGGIRACTGTTVEMTAGTISGNTAALGAGIYGDGSTVTQTGGTISENEAKVTSGSESSTGIGGGVYMTTGDSSAASSFTSSGGTLANNTAGTSAADVYCDSSCTITLSGTESVNTGVKYTPSGCTITGWYVDVAASRYAYPTNITETKSETPTGTEWFIIAAHDLRTSVVVTKVWDDSDDADAVRPDSVTMTLYADGAVAGVTAELSAENSWAYTFDDIAAYSGSSAIAYTVVETAVDGYTAAYSDTTGSISEGYEITVTNVHEAADEEIGDDTEDTEDTDDADDTDDTDDTEDVEEVEATDTGDPGMMLWIALLGAAAVCILTGRKRIAK